MLRAYAAVVAAALLFGSTFVVVKNAISDVAPVPFLGVRFLVAGAAMAAVARGRPRRAGEVRAGVVCAAALGSGYVLQTIGLQYTSAAVSAFVTYLLVVVVPVLSALRLRAWPSRPVAVGVALCVVGLFLLTGRGVALGRGEILTLGCALAFAVHIVLLADLAPRFDVVRLNAVQMLVIGGACAAAGTATGGYAFSAKAWWAALFTGVAASALAMTLQMYGQRRIGPTRTALLLMIEPVSAAVLGLATGDRLGATGAIGAAIILVGIAVGEAPLLTERSTRAKLSPPSAAAPD